MNLYFGSAYVKISKKMTHVVNNDYMGLLCAIVFDQAIYLFLNSLDDHERSSEFIHHRKTAFL